MMQYIRKKYEHYDSMVHGICLSPLLAQSYQGLKTRSQTPSLDPRDGSRRSETPYHHVAVVCNEHVDQLFVLLVK